MNINVNNHIKGALKTTYYYFLGLIIAIAPVPAVAILPINYGISLFIWSLLSLILTSSLLYIAMHDFGEIDKKPYNWKRYSSKGLVLGFLGMLPYFLVELVLIYVAQKYISSDNLPFSNPNVRGYITGLIYLPFFWVYKLINPEGIMPPVNYLTSLIPFIYITAVSGFGYFMGFKDKRIIKNVPKGEWFKYIVYGREQKKNERKSKANRKLQ